MLTLGIEWVVTCKISSPGPLWVSWVRSGQAPVMLRAMAVHTLWVCLQRFTTCLCSIDSLRAVIQ
jgi:hypothetical protein